MKQLPQPLLPLAGYRQFLVCKFVPKDNGKTNKLPIDYRTMKVVSAHEPSAWISAEEACAVANALGPDYGVAFTFTERDPFWFVDIDGCLTEQNTWSDVAMSVLGLLPGAAVEISQSGRGLHVFGTGTVPPHGSKNGTLGLEFYHTGRFVALTGTNAIGDAGVDCSTGIQVLVDTFFPPSVALTTDQQWTSAPVPEWSGPTDDTVLIHKMLSTNSVRSALGATCSVKDLWEANAEVLGHFYPDPEDARPFDGSSADAALAQHLAFWTGRDCERIQRLMKQSGLVRDKWEREDYLPRTILKAVSQQRDVYSNNRLATAPTEHVTAPTSPDISPEFTAGHQFMTPEQQAEFFAGCVYVRHHHKAWCPDGSMMSPEQFKAVYGGYLFSMDCGNEKTTKNAWEAFTQSQAVRFPKVANVCFRPELPPGKIIQEEGMQLVNTYVPIETPAREGDISRFTQHLEKLFPVERDRQIILSYMAAVVQNPGVKFQWCPLIQGTEGNGKTLLASVLSHCVGHRYTHFPNASDLAGNGIKFTGWISGKLFVAIEDIYVSDRKEVTEGLKPLITNSRIEIQAKGADQYTGDNRTNWMLFTNHKDGIHITIDTRRYCVFYTGQQSKADKIRDGMGGTYFPDLYRWLREEGFEAINYHLRHYQVDERFNPAGNCQEAPATSSTNEALRWSMGTVEQNIMDAVEEGRPGFAKGWISSKALDRLLKEMRMDGRIHINRRRAILQSLGYDWHPGLRDGRVNIEILQEQGKPRLYVKEGSLLAQIDSPANIIKRYMQDQGYTSIDGAVSEGVNSSHQQQEMT